MNTKKEYNFEEQLIDNLQPIDPPRKEEEAKEKPPSRWEMQVIILENIIEWCEATPEHIQKDYNVFWHLQDKKIETQS